MLKALAGNGAADVSVTSRRDRAEILVPIPDGGTVSASLGGRPAAFHWTWEKGTLCLLVDVPRGEHGLHIETAPAALPAPAVGALTASVSEDQIIADLPGPERALFTVSDGHHVFFSRDVARLDGVFRIPLGSIVSEGRYELACVAVADGTSIWPVRPAVAVVTLPARKAALGITGKTHPRVPEKRVIESVDQAIRGLRVLRSAEYATSTALIGWQPELAGLVAEVDASDLRLHAGTTRKIYGFRGAAYSGLEIEDLRQVELSLHNTYCTATHSRGKGQHHPQYQRSTSTFGGILVDYHTADGYTHRVGYAVGLLASECDAVRPDYGKSGPMDTIIDLGPIVDKGPEMTFALDLAKHAPDGWDGRVWFSVGSEWAAPDHRLTATILRVNEDVTGDFLEGTNPADLAREYAKPKTLVVPRAPVQPNIDGSPDDEMWQHAATIDRFFLLGGRGYPKSTTRVHLFNDDDNLYIGVVCQDPERDKPIINHGNLWHDDEMEFMIDTDGDPTTYTQILVNGIGKVGAFRNKDRVDLDIQARALQERGRWMLEVVIPFRVLGVEAPASGDTWGFNVVRNRLAGPAIGPELITWAPLQHGFVEPENLGTLVFE